LFKIEPLSKRPERLEVSKPEQTDIGLKYLHSWA
jgi:hypothetical protein